MKMQLRILTAVAVLALVAAGLSLKTDNDARARQLAVVTSSYAAAHAGGMP